VGGACCSVVDVGNTDTDGAMVAVSLPELEVQAASTTTSAVIATADVRPSPRGKYFLVSSVITATETT
jgi:hypothetical protein